MTINDNIILLLSITTQVLALVSLIMINSTKIHQHLYN